MGMSNSVDCWKKFWVDLWTREFLMRNSQSRILDDLLGVKERAPERMMSPKRRILEKYSSASLLARLRREGVITRKPNDPVATSPHKKSPTTRGGRKRLATEKQSFYIIGYLVDQMFPRLMSC